MKGIVKRFDHQYAVIQLENKKKVKVHSNQINNIDAPVENKLSIGESVEIYEVDSRPRPVYSIYKDSRQDRFESVGPFDYFKAKVVAKYQNGVKIDILGNTGLLKGGNFEVGQKVEVSIKKIIEDRQLFILRLESSM